MNKILNINLGGYALTIDDDAYEYLNAYLESIRRRFSESEGRDEIVSDIETRLGELISQHLGTHTIVMLPDVEAAVTIMGKPEDFGGEPAAEPAASRTGSRSGRPGTPPRPGAIRTGKRLFRDPENSSVGGVCAGLSAYFGFADPVWMRLIFVLLTFLSAGFWIPAYLLFWIILPPATTAADRLAMRGEPANAENIAREVEDGFERLSRKVNDLGTNGSSHQGLSRFVAFLGNLFGLLIRIVAKFWLVIVIAVAAGLFITLLVTWASGIFALITAAPFIEYLSPFSSTATWLGFANLFFLIAIPVLGLCIISVKSLFKVRTPGWLGGTLALFWVFNGICAFVLAVSGVQEFRQAGSMTKNVDLSAIQSDTLRIGTSGGFAGRYHINIGPFEEEGVRLSEEGLEMNGSIEINVQRSNSNRFECTQVISARGRSNSEAADNAGQTGYQVMTTGNTLQIPTSYNLAKGRKWRVQQVRVILNIPVGKYVVFGEKINDYVHGDVDYAHEEEDSYIYDYPNRVFRMTEAGLVCVDCPQFGDNNYREERNYEKFILEGNFDTEIRQGDNFKMRIEGPTDAIQKIRTGDKLTLTVKDGTSSKIKVYIETPTFTSLHAENTGSVTIRGFDEGEARISARGSSNIRAYLDSNHLDVSLSGKCNVELTGRGDDLDVSLNDGATLEASSWRSEQADISAADGSKARVNVRSTVKVNADNSSNVKVEGGAREVKGSEE